MFVKFPAKHVCRRGEHARQCLKGEANEIIGKRFIVHLDEPF
jgi:hypothetical protein